MPSYTAHPAVYKLRAVTSLSSLSVTFESGPASTFTSQLFSYVNTYSPTATLSHMYLLYEGVSKRNLNAP